MRVVISSEEDPGNAAPAPLETAPNQSPPPGTNRGPREVRGNRPASSSSRERTRPSEPVSDVSAPCGARASPQGRECRDATASLAANAARAASRNRNRDSGRRGGSSSGAVAKDPFSWDEHPENAVPAHDPAMEGRVAEVESKFEAQIQARGWVLDRQEGDGNCLFRAVSRQIYGDPGMHSDIRQKCVAFMRKDRDHFSQFVEEAFDSYVSRKERDGVHANNPEMQAISELFNRPIEVYMPEHGAVPINIFHGGYQTDSDPIRVSYHGRSHYNAVIDPGKATIGQGLGIPGLSREAAEKESLKRAVADSVDYDAHLRLSDLMATERELEQAAITASIASMHHGRAHAHGGGHGDGMGDRKHSGGGVASSSSSSRKRSRPSTPPSHLQAQASGEGQGVDTEYPSAVLEVTSYGFPLARALKAYAFVGDSVDDMLMLLTSSTFKTGPS